MSIIDLQHFPVQKIAISESAVAVMAEADDETSAGSARSPHDTDTEQSEVDDRWTWWTSIV